MSEDEEPEQENVQPLRFAHGVFGALLKPHATVAPSRGRSVEVSSSYLQLARKKISGGPSVAATYGFGRHTTPS